MYIYIHAENPIVERMIMDDGLGSSRISMASSTLRLSKSFLLSLAASKMSWLRVEQIKIQLLVGRSSCPDVHYSK